MAKHLIKLQQVVFDQCDCPACTARREAEKRDEMEGKIIFH
jgi:hypothetical protein